MREGLLIACAWLVTAAPAPVEIHASARAMQPGEVVRLTVTATAPGTVTVNAFGHDVPTTQLPDSTWQALIGIDLDVRPGRHVVTVRVGGDGSTSSTYPLVVQSKAFPTRRLTVAEAFVNPPEEVQARIAAEAARLEQLWTSASPERLWSRPFVRPVTDPANSAFGSRSILNGQARSPHGGADFLSETGTPIHAPNDGAVVLAADLYYTGTTVVIDHGQGLLSLFAHLSRLDVAEGAHVTAGDVVGLVGDTGRVTGAHLHWTVRLNGARVDPLSLLAVVGERPATATATR